MESDAFGRSGEARWAMGAAVVDLEISAVPDSGRGYGRDVVDRVEGVASRIDWIGLVRRWHGHGGNIFSGGYAVNRGGR
jgi:hypothetical protein